MTKGWTAFSVWYVSGTETEKNPWEVEAFMSEFCSQTAPSLRDLVESLKTAMQEWVPQMWKASRHCWKDIMARAANTKLKPAQYWTPLSAQNATYSIKNAIPLEYCFPLALFFFFVFQIQMPLHISIYQKENCLPLCKPWHVIATSTVSSKTVRYSSRWDTQLRKIKSWVFLGFF